MTPTEINPVVALNIAIVERRIAEGVSPQEAFLTLWKDSLKDERKPKCDSPARGPGRPARKGVVNPPHGPDRDNKIIALHQAGKTRAEIMEATGASIDVVFKTLRRKGALASSVENTRRRAIAKDVMRCTARRAVIAAYRDEGKKAAEISALTGLPYHIVKRDLQVMARKVAA